MKILLTGGAGFIGSHVGDALLSSNHEVTIVDDLSTGRRASVPAGARFVELDIRDGERVFALVEEVRPDAVCHQAAQTSVSVSTREPHRDAEINVLGTLNLLHAVRTSGVARFVYASTGGAVYGEVAEDERAGVDRIPRPLSPYACSKLAGEHYAQAYAAEYGFACNILRYANVYGPRQDPHGEAGVVAIFSHLLLRGEKLRTFARRVVGDRGGVRDYIYVSDVVRANLVALAGTLGAHSVTNVCTGIGTDTLGVAELLSRAYGTRLQIEAVSRRPGDLERSVLDPAVFIENVGIPIPIDHGLQETAAWFRAQR